MGKSKPVSYTHLDVYKRQGKEKDYSELKEKRDTEALPPTNPVEKG